MLSGCALEIYNEPYSSPEKTVMTYLTEAAALAVVADHRNFRSVMHCFTDEMRSWFKSNHKDFNYKRAMSLYHDLYKTKKMAYDFGKFVIPHGPPLKAEIIKVDENSANEAVIRLSGYDQDIRLVKIKNRWLMDSLFGVEEKPAVEK